MINSKSFSYIAKSITGLSNLKDLKMNCIIIINYFIYVDNEIGDEGMKSLSEAYSNVDEMPIRSFFISGNYYIVNILL